MKRYRNPAPLQFDIEDSSYRGLREILLLAFQPDCCLSPLPLLLLLLQIHAPELADAGRLLPDRILKINGSTEPAVLAGMDIGCVTGEERNFKVTTRCTFRTAFFDIEGSSYRGLREILLLAFQPDIKLQCVGWEPLAYASPCFCRRWDAVSCM